MFKGIQCLLRSKNTLGWVQTGEEHVAGCDFVDYFGVAACVEEVFDAHVLGEHVDSGEPEWNGPFVYGNGFEDFCCVLYGFKNVVVFELKFRIERLSIGTGYVEEGALLVEDADVIGRCFERFRCFIFAQHLSQYVVKELLFHDFLRGCWSRLSLEGEDAVV